MILDARMEDPAEAKQLAKAREHNTCWNEGHVFFQGVERWIYSNDNTIKWEILLMVQKSGDHQLRLVVYPIIDRVLYIPGGCLGFLNHQQYFFQSPRFSVCIDFNFQFVDFLELYSTKSEPHHFGKMAACWGWLYKHQYFQERNGGFKTSI